MYKTLIVEPHDFSLKSLLELPIWDGDFVCAKIATNGQEALEIASNEDFDLILTEINLPIFDGLQLLKRIHKDNQPPLVVFISDIVSFSYAREGFIYGIFDYLPKPVDKQTMDTLFNRAARELEKYKANLVSPHSQVYFSQEKIDNIVNGVIQHRDGVIDEFCDVVCKLYNENNDVIHSVYNGILLDSIVNKLYTSIINEVYKLDGWLVLYLPRDFHRQEDYVVMKSLEDYINYYRHNLTILYDIIGELSPRFNDETLTKVYLYMLNNPEDDLKLTSVAAKFFVNHTYLSNLFGLKSDMHYSQVVTFIKLKRAEYLIKYTSMPLIDISEQLGYKDYQYFCRLYKTTIGKAPNDYVRMQEDGNNYSI
jgi:two-component system response regulator YesN